MYKIMQSKTSMLIKGAFMNRTYACPECGNMLLKITKVENGQDIDNYYCDICSISFKLKELENPKKTKTCSDKK
jgi:transcription elongation factor Elf1